MVNDKILRRLTFGLACRMKFISLNYRVQFRFKVFLEPFEISSNGCILTGSGAKISRNKLYSWCFIGEINQISFSHSERSTSHSKIRAVLYKMQYSSNRDQIVLAAVAHRHLTLPITAPFLILDLVVNSTTSSFVRCVGASA